MLTVVLDERARFERGVLIERPEQAAA